MPLLSRRQEKPTPVKGKPVPKDIEDRIARGREAMLKDANLRELCQRFWDGDQYSYLGKTNGVGVLLRQDTITTATGGKPPHRIRKTYNHIRPLVQGKVSAATQRVPSYEVIQTTSDHKDYAAARLAEKVAVALYDSVRVRRATTKLVTNALVQREGFVMAYFDPNVGPFVPMLKGEDLEMVGMGAIRLRVYSRSEVMWEPEEDFEDSRWYAFEDDHLIEEIEKLPGYVGGKIVPDAKGSKDRATLTKYLERPCPEYPDGRCFYIANGKVITSPEEGEYDTYPLRDYKGRTLDEPAAHRLSYVVNTGGDDRGMVEAMIDPQQTVNDCTNKLLEWKNRTLNPQWSAPRGSNMTRRSDAPGEVNYYDVIGGQKPEQERPIPIPRELFEIREMALQDMRVFASALEVPQDLQDVAAKSLAAASEQSDLQWQSFLGDLAEVHSRLGRDMLTLAQLHFTEERLIEYRGQYSWESVPDFQGQDLRGQVNVRVRPDSLEAKGPVRAMEELRFMGELYPGAIPPEAAWSALQGGNGEGLLKSYENHVARAWRRVEELKRGIEWLEQRYPPRQDFEVGDPGLMFMVPGWMPRKQDNSVIWKQVFADAMTSPWFDDLSPDEQAPFFQVFDAIEFQEQRKAMMLAVKEQNAAAELGQMNAAKPQGEAPLPADRQLSPGQADPASGA